MGVVLVVEEVDRDRVLGTSILERAGYQVLPVASSEEAFDVLNMRTAIDLLFTGISMRGDNHGGLALAQTAVQIQPTLPVLYTTGQGISVEMRTLFVPRFAFLG